MNSVSSNSSTGKESHTKNGAFIAFFTNQIVRYMVPTIPSASQFAPRTKILNGDLTVYSERSDIARFEMQLSQIPVLITTIIRHMYAVLPPISAYTLWLTLENRSNSMIFSSESLAHLAQLFTVSITNKK